MGRGGGSGPVRDGRRRRRRRRGRVCGPQSPGAQRQRALGAPDRSAALGRGDRGTQGHPSQGARAPDSPAEPRSPSPQSSSPSLRGRPSARRPPLWLAVLPGGRGGACTGTLGSDHLGLPAGLDVRGRCAALRGAPHAAATQRQRRRSAPSAPQVSGGGTHGAPQPHPSSRLRPPNPRRW